MEDTGTTTRRGLRTGILMGGLLCVLLAVAEFVFPNYVTRITGIVRADVSAVLRGESLRAPRGTILSNEFVIRTIPLEDASTTVVAGVLGPDAEGHFSVIEQSATVIAGRDIGPLLETMQASYPEELDGGFKQLIEVDGALFGLFGLVRDTCVFAALIDLDRLELVDEYPCLDAAPEHLTLHGLGGGYDIPDGTSLLLALGTGSGFTRTQANANAQLSDSPYGKILHYDITLEADGPRLSNRRTATSGHRNPQGMVRLGDLLLAVEHGPMGGDEINVIELGANYGWPLYSAGSQYNNGNLVSFAPDGGDYVNPLFSFVPSVATSDITSCPSIIATRYATADCVIVSGLASRAIFIVLGDFANRRVWSVERIDVGERVREVFVHDDTLYLVPDRATIIRADVTLRPCDETDARGCPSE